MGDEKYSYESDSASTGAGKCLVETTTGAKQDPVSAVPSQVSPIREGGYGYVVVFAAFMTQFIVDGICYSYAILAAVLVDRYGYRKVTIAGSLIATFGFGLSTLVTTIGALMVTFGVIGGVGLGLIYLPGIIAVANYFRVRRSFMMGVTVAGSGVGSFVLAPFLSFLLPEMGWKYSAVILAGLSLNGCVFGALMRPLPKPPKEATGRPERRKNAADRVRERLWNRQPSAHDAAELQDGLLEKIRLEKEERLRMEEEKEEDHEAEVGKTAHQNGTVQRCAEWGMEGDNPSETTAAEIRQKLHASRTSTLASTSMLHLALPAELVKETARDTGMRGKRPLRSTGLASNVWRSLKELRWLFGPLCVIPCVANFVAMTGLYIPFYFITQRALLLPDISKTQAAFLLSVIAIFNTVGRFVLGFVAGLAKSAPLIIHNISLVTGGVACILSMFCVNYWLNCIFAAYFGLCVAGWISLTSIIMCDLLGEEKLALSFGVLNGMRGFATFIGPPLAGLVYDWTHDYSNSFHVGGTMLTIGGIICCFLHLPSLQRMAFIWQTQQQQQQQQQQKQKQEGNNTVDISQPHKMTA